MIKWLGCHESFVNDIIELCDADEERQLKMIIEDPSLFNFLSNPSEKLREAREISYSMRVL